MGKEKLFYEKIAQEYWDFNNFVWDAVGELFGDDLKKTVKVEFCNRCIIVVTSYFMLYPDENGPSIKFTDPNKYVYPRDVELMKILNERLVNYTKTRES